MDDIPHNSIAKERRFFLSKFKTQPRFAIKHLRALSALVIQRYHHKILSAWRSTHRGHKRFPHFLSKLKQEQFVPASSADQLFEMMPERIVNHQLLPETFNPTIMAECQDPEAYLAKQRWGDLIFTSVTGQQQKLISTISSRIQNLPDYHDPAWETYSSCERVCNLLTWLTVLTPQQRHQLDTHACLDFIAHSLHWIYTHLEFYGKHSSNHILNNARALIMGGLVINQPRIVQAGIKILSETLPLFIQAQGSLRERSSHYQLIILTWILDAHYFLYAYAWPISADLEMLRDYGKRMCKTARLLCNDEGDLIAYIGDISPDAPPRLTTTRLKVFYPHQWLMNTDAYQQRDDWLRLHTENNTVILNGHQGSYPPPYPTHAHNDITSFIWHHQSQAVLIDPGRIRYTKDAIATQQKSALAHNILLVNQFAPMCESFVIQGNWSPTPYAKARVHLCMDTPNSIKIRHNGYARATAVMSHQRQITIVAEDQLCVIDELKGEGEVVATLLWQLDPTFIPDPSSLHDFNSQDYDLHLTTESADGAPHIQVLRADENLTWCSTRYSTACLHTVVMVRYTTRLPATLKTNWRITPCVV